MNLIIEIIGAACLGALVMNFEPYLKALKYLYLEDTKPFSCTMCLTFWATIGYFAATNGLSGIFLSSTAAILAELIDRKLNNYE